MSQERERSLNGADSTLIEDQPTDQRIDKPTDNRQVSPAEKVLCPHCLRTASNGIKCQGICVADSDY